MTDNTDPDLTPTAEIGAEDTPSRFTKLQRFLDDKKQSLLTTPKIISTYIITVLLVSGITGVFTTPYVGFGILMITTGTLIITINTVGDTVTNTDTRTRAVYYLLGVLFIGIGIWYTLPYAT